MEELLLILNNDVKYIDIPENLKPNPITLYELDEDIRIHTQVGVP